ncbi:MAG: zinc ribbon domain-containing protein [Candidatus Acidiferrales bacterium]
MYLCPHCQRPINSASAICPYCGANQDEPDSDLPQAQQKKRSSLKLVIAVLCAVAGIWAIIWFALPLRFENPRPAAERSALESVRALQHQLATYENGAASFPTSLEALGEPAREAAQTAMAGGYSIRYTPTQPDATGNPHAFTLVAVPRNYGYQSFYTDQSGVIHATRDNRPATAQDPPLR